MKLQTVLPLRLAENPIDYQSRLLFLGSCFSQNIGEKFEYYKFRSFQHPFGIVFHPKAIETHVGNALRNKVYTDDDIFYGNEQWHCFDAHSDLSDASKERLLQTLNDGIKKTLWHITEATHIFITLGTAWAYRHEAAGKVVANCHKIPQKEFSKVLFAADEIEDSLQNIVTSIRHVNKKTQFIFTVSPVRHLKDGFIENQRSKSHLISAIHQVLEKNVTLSAVEGYFPAYEIMMDELRDYRYYEADMIHPNQTAIDYIYEKLKTVWIAEESYPTMDEVAAVQKGLLHRPFNPDSEAHQAFTKSLEQKITYLKERYPFMDF